MKEKRNYSRLETKIYGSLYKDSDEIPIIIYNISETGIGLRYQYKDCPDNFTVGIGDIFNLSFFDEDTILPDQNIQICTFKVMQIRLHTTHGYIGAKLINSENNYFHYVENKKASKFAASVKFIPFTSNL